VYGELRTADALSPVGAPAVAWSFGLFVALYTALLLAFFFYATRAVLRGPELEEAAETPHSVHPGMTSAPAMRAVE
jgi:cytochrome d ubiquinol oxidase subunit I